MKKTTKLLTLLVALVMVLTVVLSACSHKCNHVCPECGKCTDATCKDPACKDKCQCNGGPGAGTFTYNTYASNIPTYWNPLDYKDADASDMYGYCYGSFYEFDYAFDDNGNVLDGGFSIVNSMASGKPVDVTAEYVGETYGIAEGDVARAWKIPLRSNLRWDDGTAITAVDFVESMKLLLDPVYKHYRADSFYAGSTVIANARAYYYQGESVWTENFDGETEDVAFELSDLVKGDNGLYTFDGMEVKLSTKLALAWLGGYPLAALPVMGINEEAAAKANALLALADSNGDIALTQEALDLLIAAITTDPAWGETEEEAVVYMYYNAVYGEMDFDQVGVKSVDDGSALVVIFEKPFAADGNMFSWAYNMGGFPLVKIDLYKSLIKAPTDGSAVYTFEYCTSPKTTPSFGPYKLTSLQLGKQYVFEKNTNWFGYELPENEGKYQTTRIVCDLMESWDTAWMAFQQGKLSAVSIDPKIADEYKTSSRAYFTPSDYVDSLQIQSQETDRVVNAEDGCANELLLNAKFRQAISLGFDRAKYVATCTTSSQAGFGLFGPIHYYDVENGKVYRNEDLAKQVLCDVYGINVEDYPSLDDAYEALTGYNLELARKLVKEAIAEELEKGTITAADTKLELTVGSSVDNEAARRPYNFLNEAMQAILVGSSLEGKLTLSYDGTHNSSNSAFADDFLSGQYEFVFAGWNGAAWDPFWFLTAYLADQYRYARGWIPEDIVVEITVENFEFADGSHTASMNLIEWYDCINGNSGAKYNMAAGIAEMNDRLIIASEIEKQILISYCTIPVSYSFGAALRSYQVKTVSSNYHTFMGWGGVAYYQYNYNDAEWAAYVASQGGTLDYKK